MFRGLTLLLSTHIGGTTGLPVGRRGRWLLVGYSLVLLGGFALACRLEPDPRGFGTHQRLGLPPCTLRAMWDLPCPSCGMTTSFANFVRGRFAEALRANVGGTVLAFFCAAQIPWCWLSAWRGRLAGLSRPAEALLAMLIAVGVTSGVEWVVRLCSR